MKYETSRAVGDAAQQSGGTGEGLGLGAGIGMGAGMAGMISQAMQSTTQPQQTVSDQPAATATPEVMTLDEAAAYLKISSADVQSLIDSGELKARKIGSQYRIGKSVIDEFLGG